MLALGAAASTARAQPGQAYPSKPVRMVIPWPPGGGADIAGRILAEPLGQALGQQIVVENRGGSNGVIGAEAVARAVPDGYTIMFHSITSHMLNPSFFPKLPYDTFADFAPIGLVAQVPLTIVVNPALPVKTLTDLIVLAKKKPGELSFASFGAGSISQLAGELFNRSFGVKLTHIPYKGGGPALIDTLGGHVPIYFSGVGTVLPQLRAGKLRALGVTTAARSKLLPDVPTVDEALGSIGYEAAVMFGMLGPAKTPPEVVARLNSETVRLLNSPEFIGRLLNQGGSDRAAATSPQDMVEYMKTNTPRWAALVKEIGARID
ncbi:MAG: tripartite tricarboxylate transporter substrate binding protein [Proteobacteria bacterium]|nr:tripartite tricarboxylate transporter substrate binding protein [Burkholderiales bacterium]